MRNCGFKLAKIGFEAGNDEDLKIYNKRASLQQNIETMELLEKYDIYTGFIGFIMFNPYTTRNKLTLNYRFLSNANICYISKYTSILMISKDTEIFCRAKRDDLLTYEGEFYQDEGFSYKFEQPDIREIYEFVKTYLNAEEVWKLSERCENSANFIFSFYEFVENGDAYKNKMMEILKKNADVLKSYFFHLYEKFNVKVCEDMFPKMINQYSENVQELSSLRYSLYKKYIKISTLK